MKTIKLIDITLRKFNNRETALTFKEKLEIARVLDRLKVDILELPPIREGKVDQLSNKTIASMVNVAVTASVRLDQDDIQETWESIRGAKKPRLNLVAPVSPVQMEYSCRKKAPAMLEAIREKVKECRFYCETVEFTAADATRAEMDFLCEALTAAIEAGAGKVTLCDTAGVMLPDEFTAFLREIKERVPALADVQLYVQLSDELHVGTACAAAAIACGADGIKCTMLPSECPTAIDMVNLIQVKGDSLDVRTGMRTTELKRAADHLGKMLASKEETDSPLGNIAIGQVSGVCLDANDDIGEVVKLVRQMGYDLSDEDNSKVYEAFLRVAKKKQFVGTRELDAIIASTALQVPTIYHIDSYVINCGNVITATANVLLDRQGEKLRGVGVGDGPIDAAFLAIEQIVGHKYELDDFQIQTVTEGRDAMGSALVKLRANGKVYSGSGISTDIIGASIRAYLSALNKILYEAS
jgi:2-isopropylmalate synthase